MENYPKPQDHKENPPPQTPNSGAAAAAAAASSPTPTARPGSRPSDPVPYPTTFVQAEPSTFKQVVQMLTGSSDTVATAAASPKHPPAAAASVAAAAKGAPGPKKPAFKLYERRSSTLKSLKVLSPLMPAFVFSNPASSPIGGGAASAFSPRGAAEVLSPSLLDLPSLVLSPVTPLLPDPFARPPPPPPPGTQAADAAEERAIAEKGFYLHPSPRAGVPPRLLPLFPVTSPRLAPAPAPASASASSSASASASAPA